MTAIRQARPLALITGASSGIGATFARQLAARGYDLVLAARRRDRLEGQAHAIQESHSVQTEILPADLTHDADLKAVEDRIAAAPNLEFLVNNAGFGIAGRFFSFGRPGPNAPAARSRPHAADACRPAGDGRPRARQHYQCLIGFGLWTECRQRRLFRDQSLDDQFHRGHLLGAESIGSPVRVQALCPGFTLSEFHDTMHFDRNATPAWMWMSADEVVATSLRALDRGQLFVIPGWRYRLLVFLMRAFPRPLYRWLSIRYARGTRRAR